MKRAITCFILTTFFAGTSWAEVKLQQVPTTSWQGLTGLYVMPTARSIGRGKLALGFNESKHSEFIENAKFADRQIRGVGTYGITDNLEITAATYNDMFTIPPDRTPQLSNESFWTFGFKVLLLREDPHYWYPAVAFGVRDIFDATTDVGPLKNVNNGRRFFLLASKRMLKDEKIGRFWDVHAGLTYEQTRVTGLMGMELALAPNASLIAEGIYDSPYLNFREFGSNDVPGRFLFNTGLRIYPELVPGMALDLGFVGDSEFEFSFGTSYVISL
ncbi:MAG: YjbH domain-containing protein [Armatimonadetes bacterium]|nr:YjbH domain-containing protein [Armatimonadota bacterium]